MEARDTAMKGRLFSRTLTTCMVWPFSRGAGREGTRSLVQR